MTRPAPLPFYLGPTTRPLAAFLHEAVRGPSSDGRVGVLMVSPFGWEEVASYRIRRRMADHLADSGFAVLRYDLAATGDSAGGPGDPRLLEEWISSIELASDELRRAARVDRVVVFGVRVGAMLALAAAQRTRLDGVIAWAPSARGRAIVRELRAFRNLETSNDAPRDESGPPIDGMEAAGFRLSAETVAGLEALDLSKAPDTSYEGLRVLHLTRDDMPADDRLIQKLTTSGAVLEERPGAGFGAMTSAPDDSRFPTETMAEVVRWLGELTTTGSGRAPSRIGEVSEVPCQEALVADGVRESMVIGRAGFGETFAVRSEPSAGAPRELAVLFLNAGAVRHTGPNRLWVESARRLALQGVPSLRVDLEGIGESGGESSRYLDVESFYDEDLITQSLQAVDRMVERGATRIAVVGLCSGAFQAFHAAARDPRVVAAVMVNARLFFWDPEVERQRAERAVVDSLGSGSSWRKLLAGGVSPSRALHLVSVLSRRILGRVGRTRRRSGSEDLDDNRFDEALAQIERHGSRTLLVFSDGEPLYRELGKAGRLPDPDGPPWWRLRRTGDAGHTFRPLRWQQELVEIIDAEVEALLSPRSGSTGSGESSVDASSAEATSQTA